MCNVGGIDRILRIVVGIVIVLMTMLSPGNSFSWLLMVIGIVMGLSGIIGFCPLYKPLNINTGCKKK